MPSARPADGLVENQGDPHARGLRSGGRRGGIHDRCRQGQHPGKRLERPENRSISEATACPTCHARGVGEPPVAGSDRATALPGLPSPHESPPPLPPSNTPPPVSPSHQL